jgi:hypothetical protein
VALRLLEGRVYRRHIDPYAGEELGFSPPSSLSLLTEYCPRCVTRI